MSALIAAHLVKTGMRGRSLMFYNNFFQLNCNCMCENGKANRPQDRNIFVQALAPIAIKGLGRGGSRHYDIGFNVNGED
jgi:hypothetical protein